LLSDPVFAKNRLDEVLLGEEWICFMESLRVCILILNQQLWHDRFLGERGTFFLHSGKLLFVDQGSLPGQS